MNIKPRLDDVNSAIRELIKLQLVTRVGRDKYIKNNEIKIDKLEAPRKSSISPMAQGLFCNFCKTIEIIHSDIKNIQDEILIRMKKHIHTGEPNIHPCELVAGIWRLQEI
jgi:hypothetical protein